MTRTINDLRNTLAGASADPPDNHRRMAEIDRSIRRGTRRRAASGVLTGVAALVIAGVLVLPGTEQISTSTSTSASALPLSASPSTTAAEAGELPSTYQGLKRIAYARYSVTGEVVRLRFTPVGPDTTIIIQCRPGFEAVEQAATGGGFASCAPDGSLPGDITSSTGTNGYLYSKRGKSVLLSIVVVAQDSLKRAGVHPAFGLTDKQVVAITGQTMSLERYLDTHPKGSSPWSVAVYSGTCENAGCFPEPAPQTTAAHVPETTATSVPLHPVEPS